MNKQQAEESYYQNIMKSATWHKDIDLTNTGIQSFWNTIPYWAIASTNATFIPTKRNIGKIIGFSILGLLTLSLSVTLGFLFILIAIFFYAVGRKNKVYVLEVTNNAGQVKKFCTSNPEKFVKLKSTIELKVQEAYQRHR